MTRTDFLEALILITLAISGVSCSSVYVPTTERYQEELEGLLNKPEDFVLVYYGKPDEILRLSEGVKGLVYYRSAYSSSPITYDKTAMTCRTVFQVDQSLQVRFIRAEGSFCVR